MSISTGLAGSIIQAFSWMLIHSLWQGLLLALIAGIILVLTKRASAAARYNLVLVLFSVFLLTVACTFAYEYDNARREFEQSQLSNNFKPVISKVNAFSSSRVIIVNNFHSEASSPFYSAKNISAYLKTVSDYFSEHSFMIVMLWLIFFVAKSVLMAGNMLYMHRARRYQVYEPDGYWKERVEILCEKLQLKKAVSLLESGYLKVPVVVGYLKPVILVPVGLIAGIPAAQVEAILLHELAHIRRNDYMVNFLQNVVEAVFFFNPGLLWISARLKEERENCCDDMAIAQTNNKQAYVQALISFKEYAVSMPGYAVAFSGQKSSLINRVMRIVYQENKTLSIKENGIFILGIAMLSLMAFTIYPLKDTKPHVKVSSNKQQTLKDVNIVGAAYKHTAIPKITASDARITGVGTFGSARSVFDSTKVSAISGIEKTGPNFIAIIDDKEYPKDILYKISRSCIYSEAVFNAEYGLKKYGSKASDGYVQITTRQSEITYMTAVERENLIKEYSIPKSKFYNRITLKKEDGSFDHDRIVMMLPDGSVLANFPSNGKAGFYIDKNFYTEEAIQKISPAIIASFTGEYGVERSDPKVPREKGYNVIFKFNTKKVSATTPAPDAVKYPRVIGKGLGPNPLVLVNGKEHSADILYKINRLYINEPIIYGPEQAVKKFGDKAKDGYVEITTAGPIVYLTPSEQGNRIVEASVDKNKLYTRIVLNGKNGTLSDRIYISELAGNTVNVVAIPHNGKAGFYIDKDFYTEETIQKVSPAIIASLRGQYSTEPNPTVDREKGYAVIFHLTTEKTSPVIPAHDTVKYGRVIGEGLGPNPLVLIDGKEYPADILYNINRKCFNGSDTYYSKKAIEKFGDKAKDGCVEIRTKGGIVYLTTFEIENKAKEASVPKNKFYTRIVLKDNNGGLFDKIIINDPSGNGTLTEEVSHNGKVGFYIDKDFYEEEDIKKLTPAMLASLSGESGCRPPDLRIDKAGYESIFDYTTTKYYQAMKKDSAEFNTAQFKVNKNAPVTTLLESMPGIKVEPDGAVFYKGVIVTKLFLNNTPYAGEGILQGIQSLPADIVEKIQVKPSTQDNGRAKMINLITKGKDRLAASPKKRPRYATWADY